MASATRLYTPEILALAMSLAEVPDDPTLPMRGHARSPTCGSTLALALSLDGAGNIDRVGVSAQACAIGQASAALFVRHVIGRSERDIVTSRAAVIAWLEAGGPLPAWPEFAVLDPARAFPARHGAILLAWDAALDALSSTGLRR